MKPNKLLKLAVPVLVASMGLSSNAHADAYALSYDGVTQGIIDVWQPVAIPGTAACSLINSGTGGVANCAVGTFITNFAQTPQNKSAASATLNGIGPAASDGPSAGLVDTPMAATGTAVGTAENNYTPIGLNSAQYSRGDSVLTSEQGGTLNASVKEPDGPLTTDLDPGFTLTSTIAAEAIAEGFVTGDNKAGANADISSGTLTTITIVLDNPGIVAFSFDADPFTQATLSADAGPGSVARATISANVTITQTGGTEVFTWSPNGSGAGSITNGTVVADPFSLNQTTENQVAGTTSSYDPTTDGIGGTSGSFSAYTTTLAAGTYTLSLAFGQVISVTSTPGTVPEPAIVALMGLSLFGFGFARRRKG